MKEYYRDGSGQLFELNYAPASDRCKFLRWLLQPRRISEIGYKLGFILGVLPKFFAGVGIGMLLKFIWCVIF